MTPSGAGTITGNTTSAVFTASATWTGTCNIKVRGSSQCGDGQTTTYTTSPINEADVYIWTLTPEEAGVLTPVSDTAHIAWNPGYTGMATLSVHGENLCGEGAESEPLEINVYLAPIPEILGLELACADYEENTRPRIIVAAFIPGKLPAELL